MQVLSLCRKMQWRVTIAIQTVNIDFSWVVVNEQKNEIEMLFLDGDVESCHGCIVLRRHIDQ